MPAAMYAFQLQHDDGGFASLPVFSLEAESDTFDNCARGLVEVSYLLRLCHCGDAGA